MSPADEQLYEAIRAAHPDWTEDQLLEGFAEALDDAEPDGSGAGMPEPETVVQAPVELATRDGRGGPRPNSGRFNSPRDEKGRLLPKGAQPRVRDLTVLPDAPGVKGKAGRPKGTLNKVAAKMDPIALKLWNLKKTAVVGGELPEGADALGLIEFDGDALDFLKSVYRNPLLETPIRIKAAESALPYERAKFADPDAATGNNGVQVVNIIQVAGDDKL